LEPVIEYQNEESSKIAKTPSIYGLRRPLITTFPHTSTTLKCSKPALVIQQIVEQNQTMPQKQLTSDLPGQQTYLNLY
jgi:hypothetical protein